MKRSIFFPATLLIFAISILISCSSRTSYTIFRPPEGSLFTIEFEYPSSWTWEDIRPGFVGTHIRNKNDFADMAIFIYKEETLEETLRHTENVIHNHFEWAKNHNAVTADTSGFIDGYPARFISIELPPNPYYGETTPKIQENVYLFANNRVYFLILNIDKDKRENAFGRGFDHLVETIKVIDPPVVSLIP